MSDFLSKFDRGNTSKRSPRDQSDANTETTTARYSRVDRLQTTNTVVEHNQDSELAAADSFKSIAPVEHELIHDKGYAKRKAIQWIIIAAIVIALGVTGLLIYNSSQQVILPDLVGNSVIETQNWARENAVELDLAYEFSYELEKDRILSQETEEGATITRGSVLKLTVSQGLDPDELLSLPDFARMKHADALRWIDEHHATNLRIVQEYHDTIPKDELIRSEIKGDTVRAETYTRKDYATLYYSKGPEVFEKNITVPNFVGKPQMEAESWATTNGITLEISEVASSTVAMGSVISQSVAADEKLAKKDTMQIVVSLGKSIAVPNYANYNAQTASQAAMGLSVIVETQFSTTVPYGKLIWQSVGAGYGVMPDDDIIITVVYSEGRPYLKDYQGMSEGELANLFWNDYTSKGANVTYDIVYVDSYEPRGSVVTMSNYSTFIPMDYHVTISISKGNLAPPPTGAGTESG